MFGKIVVAFDGSTQAQAAFRWALDLAQKLGSELLVVSVVRLAEPSTRVEVEAVVEEGEQHFAEEHRKLALLARERGVPCRSEIDVGPPAEHVMNLAETAGADLIVVGRRGRNSFERLLMGSVSERILRHAHCPVLVVH
jgi:nucleotide-binding universal stress UspA family protein